MQGAGQSGPCHRYLALYLGFEEIEDNYYHFSIDEQLSQMLGSGDEIIFLRLGKYAPYVGIIQSKYLDRRISIFL